MDLSKTVLLALPEKAKESVYIIKNAAIKCIREKDDHFASRGMLDVASALCDIAEKRPDLTMTIRDCIDEITSADKKTQEFGPAANLRFAIKKRNMQDVLLIKEPLSPEKMMTGNLLNKVKE